MKNKTLYILFTTFLFLSLYSCEKETANIIQGCDAADYGFSPHANAKENVVSLQKALDENDVVIIKTIGVYQIDSTITLKSNNKLFFNKGSYIKKSEIKLIVLGMLSSIKELQQKHMMRISLLRG